MESLSILNLALLVVTFYCTWQGFRNPTFRDEMLFSTEHILVHRQYWRILTSGFVHADWPHFIFNMYALYSFGKMIEWVLGPAPYAIIYFSAIVGGSLLSLLLHRREYYRALGASGGVCGVIYASIFLVPGGGVYLYFVPIPIPSWLFAIVYVIISFIGARDKLGNVGHDAHLGGAFIGLLAATALYPRIIFQQPVLYAMVAGLSLASVIWLYRYPFGFPTMSRSRPAPRRPRLDDAQRLDQLLAKISNAGMDSLTEEERRELARLSRRR